MDIRRKISNAYSKGDPGKPNEPEPDSEQKPLVRPVFWKAFTQENSDGSGPIKKQDFRADKGAANNRTTPIPSESPGMLKTVKDGEGIQKAAKFLLLIGKDEAAKIMRHLSEEELFDISSAMAEVGTVSKQEAESLLRQFGFLKVPPRSSVGGVDTAKALLAAAFGPEKAENVVKKVLPFGGTKPFSFLEEYEAHQIASLLKKESSRVTAIVLRFLSTKKSSAVLKSLPVSLRVEVVRRLGRMDRIDSESLERMQVALREKIRTMGKVVTQEVDGPATLAAILKHLSLDHEERLLQDIEEANPELGEEIKDKVYTIDLLLNVSDKELQEVLRTHPDEDLARMLKGRDMRVTEKVLHNISSRRRDMIEDEMERLGAIPKREADEAAREFLDYLMKLSDQGVIHFVDRDELI